MYITFKYKNGSNPYITTSNENLFKMIVKYNLHLIDKDNYIVINERRTGNKTYKEKRELLKNFAFNWIVCFELARRSWVCVADWCDFFKEYGKRYGLLREFRENGII